MNGINPVSLGLPGTIRYYGEGEFKSFTPAGAVPGIGAHEAMNLRAFNRTALQEDKLATDQQIVLKMDYDPASGKAFPAGGESRATLVTQKKGPGNLGDLKEKDASTETGNLLAQSKAGAAKEDTAAGSAREQAAMEKLRASKDKIRNELAQVQQKMEETASDSEDGETVEPAADIRLGGETRAGEAQRTPEGGNPEMGKLEGRKAEPEQKPEIKKLEGRKAELEQKLNLLDKVLSKETMKESIRLQQQIMQTLGSAQALNLSMVKLARGMGDEETSGVKKLIGEPAAPGSAVAPQTDDAEINIALAQL